MPFLSLKGRWLMASSGYHERIDYEWIKQTAKAQGVSVNEYIVLAPQNDPFYTGTPSDRALGEWFAQVWYRMGESRAHLRRVHYYLVSLGSVVFPNGKPYENTVECWDTLNIASKAARYLRLVDPGAFNDRRTPEVLIYASDRRSERPSVGVYSPTYSLGMRLPDFPHLPQYTVDGYVPVQPYHLEVWCEKSTMNDVLAPLCERYGANLQTGMGEMSITATLALVYRLQQAGKPSRILYVSDFDPAGQSMPVAVSRKIEYFVRTLSLDLDIRLFPVVLTLDQVQAYQLPRTPIKESERRRVGFEQRHGEGAVELDALEALYPGQLEQILSGYLDCYYDWTLPERVSEQRRALEQALEGQWQAVMESYREEVEALREEYTRIKEEFEPRMQVMSNQLRNLWQAVKMDLEASRPSPSDYPVPLPYAGEEIGAGLYESARDYFTQVEVYKQFQGRM
ncbi:MAG TPA: hypothetical protein VKV29_09585 [Chthonomonas sp.]|uniref:hypothetical protein n=1 Tax=Chthonomonas sp. TaxID=2282153 RepID=UPI002B4B1098|nr:hypothetical protein [Chthonomonas sp.]HLH80518.1 hypothetical protein [Chthonomonas sp.]